jgi:hypothetical protein
MFDSDKAGDRYMIGLLYDRSLEPEDEEVYDEDEDEDWKVK